MTAFETVSATERYRERCEDRVAVFETDRRTVVVVADGAGGVGSGDIAAETVIREVESAYEQIQSADQWSTALKQIDLRIGSGQSTAVIVDIRPYGIAGASVGDSQAWLFCDDTMTNLTKAQNRKPLLGSGNASPVSFLQASLEGILLVATDGFCDYVKRDAMIPMISTSDFHTIPRACIELVRLASGELWDDVGIVAVRPRPKNRGRKRYSI